MAGGEIQYFFSYTRTDTEFVLKLAKELRAIGVHLWLDQLDILGGERWDRAVECALETCQGMIVVLSPSSLASDNVMDEVSYALETGKLLIPVLLYPCNIPFRLRRVQRIDFTTHYDTGFSQLLRALRIAQPPPLPTPAVPDHPIGQHVPEPSGKTPVDGPNTGQPAITIEHPASTAPARQERQASLAGHASEGMADSTLSRLQQRPVTDIFTKPTEDTYALIACATLFNAVPYIALKPYEYHTLLVPLIIILCIGYNNGKKIGVISGLIAYFPNFVLHIVCFFLKTPYFKGDAFTGVITFTSIFGTDFNFESYTFFISYFILASLGYMSAVLREKLTILGGRKKYISSMKNPASNSIYLLLIPALLCTLEVDLGMMRINNSAIYYAIPLIISFYYGVPKALSFIIGFIPAFMFSARIGPLAIALRMGFAETFVFMMAVFVAGHLCVDKTAIHHRNAGIAPIFLYNVLINICFLFNFQLWLSPYLHFNTAGFALITVLLSGFTLGSYRGFWLGIAWGALSIFEFYPMKGMEWSASRLYITCAPIVGYLGGTEIFDKPYFFRNGVLLFLIFYSLMLLDNVIFGDVRRVSMIALAFLQNAIALFIVRHTILRVVKRPHVGASHATTC